MKFVEKKGCGCSLAILLFHNNIVSSIYANELHILYKSFLKPRSLFMYLHTRIVFIGCQLCVCVSVCVGVSFIPYVVCLILVCLFNTIRVPTCVKNLVLHPVRPHKNLPWGGPPFWPHPINLYSTNHPSPTH